MDSRDRLQVNSGMRKIRERPTDFWRGCVWPTPPGMDWIVSDVEHVHTRIGGMFNSRHETVSGTWTLECSFTPGLVHARDMTGMKKKLMREPGDLLLTPPQIGVYQDNAIQGNTRVHRAWISFSGRQTDPLERLTSNRRLIAVIRDPEQCIGRRIVELAEFAATQGPASFWAVQGMFSSLLGLLLQAVNIEEGVYRLPDNARLGQFDQLAARAFEILSRDYGQRLTVNDIARRMGCSASSLTHRFARAYGESLMEMLRRLRLHHARTLIVQGCKLADVAQQTGFWDERHLAKLFTRAMGVSPGAYRRMQGTFVSVTSPS